MAKSGILAAPPRLRNADGAPDCTGTMIHFEGSDHRDRPRPIGRHDNKRPTGPGAQATRRRAAWPHGGGHAGPWLHECVAGPASARWAGCDPAWNNTHRHATDYRCLGGDHRSRSESACGQAASRVTRRATSRRSGACLRGPSAQSDH